MRGQSCCIYFDPQYFWLILSFSLFSCFFIFSKRKWMQFKFRVILWNVLIIRKMKDDTMTDDISSYFW